MNDTWLSSYSRTRPFPPDSHTNERTFSVQRYGNDNG